MSFNWVSRFFSSPSINYFFFQDLPKLPPTQLPPNSRLSILLDQQQVGELLVEVPVADVALEDAGVGIAGALEETGVGIVLQLKIALVVLGVIVIVSVALVIYYKLKRLVVSFFCQGFEPTISISCFTFVSFFCPGFEPTISSSCFIC